MLILLIFNKSFEKNYLNFFFSFSKKKMILKLFHTPNSQATKRFYWISDEAQILPDELHSGSINRIRDSSWAAASAGGRFPRKWSVSSFTGFEHQPCPDC